MVTSKGIEIFEDDVLGLGNASKPNLRAELWPEKVIKGEGNV